MTTSRKHDLSDERQNSPMHMLVMASCVLLASCASLTGGLPSLLPNTSQPSWVDQQRAQFSSGVTSVRRGIDGAVEATVTASTGAVRRVNGRPINTQDACFMDRPVDGCDVAAKSACQRQSYGDGIALASSTYEACSGSWGLRPWAAPSGVCKTKRRLQTALCW
jgi:hypothetical protein